MFRCKTTSFAVREDKVDAVRASRSRLSEDAEKEYYPRGMYLVGMRLESETHIVANAASELAAFICTADSRWLSEMESAMQEVQSFVSLVVAA